MAVEFDREDAPASGDVRAAPVAAGPLIGPCEVLIAGQAKAGNPRVNINITKEFGRAAG